MTRSSAPSAADVTFLLSAPIFAIGGAVRLTQSDGDLAAHIRMGDAILATHRIPLHSLGSYTAGNDLLVAPAWLSEVIFARLFHAGGLPLIAVVTGIIVALTHSFVALFLRSRGVDARVALATALASLILGASHWLARPHMFSILGAALTLFLLESRGRQRVVWFFLLFVLWANLHGGWLYGLLVIAVYAAGGFVEARLGDKPDWTARARSDCLAFAVAGFATLLNPYTIGLHREVLGAVTSASLAMHIDEYQPPNFGEMESLPFLIAIIAGVGLLAASRKRPSVPWLAVIAMTLIFGVRAGRNIALFGVTGMPLIALHAAQSWRNGRRPFRYFGEFARLDPCARVGQWATPMLVLLLGLGLNRGSAAGATLIEDRFDSRVFPVEAVRSAQAAGLVGRIFHPWTWGGYLLYAWPGSSLHVDPLEFSEETIDSHTRIESMQPGWRVELTRWNVELAILEVDSPLASALARDPGWSLRYRDSTAVVLQRVQPSTSQPGTQ